MVLEMLAAIDKALPNNLERSPPFVVVNDSLRDATDVIATISNRLREQITGVAAEHSSRRSMLLPATSQRTPMTVSYSSLSQLDKPELMRQERLPIRWPLCRRVDVCAPLMQTAPRLSIKACRSTTCRSGAVDLSSTGDLSRAWFREFRFDESGREYIFNDVGIEISS